MDTGSGFNCVQRKKMSDYCDAEPVGGTWSLQLVQRLFRTPCMVGFHALLCECVLCQFFALAGRTRASKGGVVREGLTFEDVNLFLFRIGGF